VGRTGRHTGGARSACAVSGDQRRSRLSMPERHISMCAVIIPQRHQLRHRQEKSFEFTRMNKSIMSHRR
jgi:hypothetical protein